MLIVAGTIRLDPSKRAEAEAAFDRIREASLKEAGCLAYQAYLDRKDPGTLLILEKWESEETLRAHFVTPHMAEFTAALPGLGVQSTEIHQYEVGRETRLM